MNSLKLPWFLSVFLILLIIVNCKDREFSNPFDTACPKEIFTPSNFKAEQLVSTVKLTWEQVNRNISGFEISRNENGGAMTEVTKLERNITFWIDNNIVGGKKYEYQIRAYAGENYSNLQKVTINPISVATVATVSTATNITSNSAVLGGNVISDGGATVTERGICYGTSQNPTTANNKFAIGNGTGEFSNMVTGLTANTTYYVRAYSINSFGISYGTDITFTTVALLPATVTTVAAIGVSSTSAILGGSVTNEGNSPVIENGICYSILQNPTTINSKVPMGSGTGAFSNLVIGLMAGTTYYVRAYAINSQGITYGAQIIFTTISILPATVTTAAAKSVGSTSAMLGGTVSNDGNSIVTENGICYSTTQNPTTANIKVPMGSGTGDYSNTVMGLNSGTIYYVRAYAINSQGTSYGAQITFTTTSLSQVIVTTIGVAGITATSAVFGGNLTSVGTTEITERGICYSTSSGPTISNTKVAIGNGTGTFSNTISGLTANTTYYVRAYAISNNETVYGNEVNFKTDKTLSLASLTTSTPTNITSTGATLGGNIISNGNATIIEQGICYSTSTNPSTDNFKVMIISGGANFNTSITLLSANTTYYVRAYAINSQGIAYGNEVSFKTELVLSIASLTTNTPTLVTVNSAILGGNIINEGNSTVTERGICYSTSANPTTLNSKSAIGSGPGTFSNTFTGLTANTTYYVRAYAINSQGIAYGNEVNFKTGMSPILAILTTSSPTNITNNSASLGGNITSDGYTSVTERGVCYSTTANPTTANFKLAIGSGIGIFNNTITGLTVNTTYYVRAYAINSQGTAYGNEVNFKTGVTLSLASLTTITPSNISNNSAILGGNITNDGNTQVTERGICYSTSANPTTANSKINIGSGTGTFSNTITGLTANTTYYVRAYAINSQGIAYGNEVNFKTGLTLFLASLTTTPPSNITNNSAVLGGNITSDGNAAITEKGICYSTSTNPSADDNKVIIVSGGAIFSTSINILMENTTYFVRAYAINSLGIAYGNEVSFKTNVTLSLASLTSSIPTNISTNSATLGGNITNDGNANITERGVCFSTNPNPTTSNTKVAIGIGTGSFNSIVTGLTPSTTFYVRAYAINSQGTAYGDEVNFKTEQVLTLASLITTSPTSITDNGAILGGNITSDGNAKITEQGFCYSSIPVPTTSNTKIVVEGVNPSFSAPITGLTATSTYYVRAYAINSQGTAYGNEVSFKTDILRLLATITTNNPTNITSSSVTLGGNITNDGNATVMERGICYSTSPNPTTNSTKLVIGSGTGYFFSTISGLTTNTTYYVRAYAINIKGTAYGLEKSFKTEVILTLASLITTSPTNIGNTTAILGGNVTDDGMSSVFERGICYSTSPNPTINSTKVTIGGGTGSFSNIITGLIVNTTYYIRAYAINSQGTAYGNELSFKTLTSNNETVTDIDGNVYHTIVIGTQVWMIENLKTTKYNDGTPIPNITDTASWAALSTGAWCNYNNDVSNDKKYGKLYNWYAVNDNRNLAPVGWHVPTDAEWITLTNYLGGEVVAGGKLKETGTTNWNSPNTGATNETGFTALPGGRRQGGEFMYFGIKGNWWSNSTSENDITAGWYRSMQNISSSVLRNDNGKSIGFSVRCIKDK